MKRIELKPDVDISHSERLDAIAIRNGLLENGYDVPLGVIAKVWKWRSDIYGCEWRPVDEDSWWRWLNYAQVYDLVNIIDT